MAKIELDIEEVEVKPVAYVEHPVKRAEKRKLQQDGYKVVDLRFMPDPKPEGCKVVKRTKTKK